MKPVDPRLLRAAPAARRWVALVALTGGVSALLAMAIALLLSQVLAQVVQQGRAPSDLTPLLLIALLAALRGGTMWAAEYAGHRGGQQVIAALREQFLLALASRGPAALDGESTGALTLAATTGMDALDVYFARYLPQLVLGAAVPALALVILAGNDLLSAAIVLVTLPLIPLFMWLLGVAAQQHIDRRWALLQRLSAYFLDVVQGLPTLRIFNRAEAQVERVRVVTEATRRATMSTLRIAFLSALVLESLSSLATALVAAEIGLRLVNGSMTLQIGLAVLIIVPEAYLPLRQVGTFFHASMDGVKAALTILDFTDQVDAAGAPLPFPPAPAVTCGEITLTDVTCLRGERGEGVRVPITCALPPGTTTLLTGPSGAGKSTLLSLLVPLLPPTGGSIQVDERDLARLDLRQWRRRLGWVPQHPALFAGTVLENLRIGAPDIQAEDADHMLARLFPDGSVTAGRTIPPDGDGLSGGERMRLALTRALLRRPALLLLDEPTAFLDPEAKQIVLDVLAEHAGGTTLVIATHDAAGFPWADQSIDLGDGTVTAHASDPLGALLERIG